MSQRIDELTPQERQWIASQIEVAQALVEAFAPEFAGQELTLEALDRGWAAWLETNQTDAALINGTINCVGATFGQFLIQSGLLRWVVATDERSSELAVYGLPGRGDVLVFPANFVAKRWERRESGFLQHAYHQIVGHVRTLDKASAEPSQPKPWPKPG